MDQALLLRGSHDFVHRVVYARFLRDILHQRNAECQVRFAEEWALPVCPSCA
jgi:hypothetical protein